ncbi:MAG: SMR family transporter [Trueperella sp.]|nr:SMR family transporter [Trueperella sp.]
MAWVVLVVAGAFEASWALALDTVADRKHPVPIAIFGISYVLSIAGLGWAMQSLPTGTSYAVWTAVGTCLTVVFAILRGKEKATVLRLALLVGLVSCVVGLRVVS